MDIREKGILVLVFASLTLVAAISTQVEMVHRQVTKNQTYIKELKQDFDRLNQPNPVMFPDEVR